MEWIRKKYETLRDVVDRITRWTKKWIGIILTLCLMIILFLIPIFTIHIAIDPKRLENFSLFGLPPEKKREVNYVINLRTRPCIMKDERKILVELYLAKREGNKGKKKEKEGKKEDKDNKISSEGSYPARRKKGEKPKIRPPQLEIIRDLCPVYSGGFDEKKDESLKEKEEEKEERCFDMNNIYFCWRKV